MGKAGEAFEKLLSIMDELREKCPWDRKQTLESLRQLTLEEVYELTEAIDLRDWQALREETGDVLLHLVFMRVLQVNSNNLILQRSSKSFARNS